MSLFGSGFTEVRPFLPIDVPLLHRLQPSGVTLDSAARLTRNLNAIESAMLHAVPLADLGMPTFVLKHGDSAYVAQYRHKYGDPRAHIVFVAPELESEQDFEAWLHLISAMVASAARRGAVTLNAEVDEGALAATLLYRAGFATYARQEIWRRSPAPISTEHVSLWRPSQEIDSLSITALYASVVPRLVMQAEAPPEPRQPGLVYERNGKIAGYLSAQEGKNGIYIQPYLHPDLCANQAQMLIETAVSMFPRADRLPVYVSVRRYQAWLHSALDALRFEVWTNEAVMVKHTTARIERAIFKPAYAVDGAVAAYSGAPVGAGRGTPNKTVTVDQKMKRIGSYNYVYNWESESSTIDRTSYHRRSGETESGAPSLSGRRA